ncbi:MAG: FkbM family methyltransferase [Haliscomenobacter sp.]|nr:FkbM family methyltransferase [Haliscomenobacter sp.]
MNWATRSGILRSELIYYWKPFQRRRMRAFYRQLVRPGDLCFDLGAHIGNRTRTFLELGARVIAVEPQPACVQYLSNRFGGYPGFALCPKAVGSKPGFAPLFVNSGNPTISTLSSKDCRNAMADASSGLEAWDVHITAENRHTRSTHPGIRNAGFCKIDVEGYELEVLQGLSHPLPSFSFEYLSLQPERIKACLDVVERLGAYEFNWSEQETMRWQEPRWIPVREIRRKLSVFRKPILSGDIYARLASFSK